MFKATYSYGSGDYRIPSNHRIIDKLIGYFNNLEDAKTTCTYLLKTKFNEDVNLVWIEHPYSIGGLDKSYYDASDRSGYTFSIDEYEIPFVSVSELG